SSGAESSHYGDAAFRLWDLETFKQIRSFPNVRRGVAVFDMAFSPDGRFIAAVGGKAGQQDNRGDIQLWDTVTGKAIRQFEGHTAQAYAVTFARTGSMIVTASSDKTIRFWEVASGGERSRITAHKGAINSLAIAPDGRTLAASSSDAPIFLWD